MSAQVAKILVISPILGNEPCFYAVDQYGEGYLTSDEANAALVTYEEYEAAVIKERATISEWTWLGDYPADLTNTPTQRSETTMSKIIHQPHATASMPDNAAAHEARGAGSVTTSNKEPRTMTATVNANLFRIVSAFISTEETRYYLKGVFVHAHQTKGVYLVATDGHRCMIAYDENGETTLDGVIVTLDKAAMAACKPNKADRGARLLRIHGDGLSEVLQDFGTNEESDYRPVAVCHRSIIDGTFPDYRRIAFPRTDEDRAPATFNHKYVADFAAAAHALTGKKDAGLRIVACGEGPALVRFRDVDHAYGVLMPLRDCGDTVPDFMTAAPKSSWTDEDQAMLDAQQQEAAE